MHLILSAISGFLLSPAYWIILLIILQFILRSPKAKKICRYGALALFLIFTNIWLVTAYAKFWQPQPRDISKDSTLSCGILLGGFGSPDENEQGYFNSSADRFIQTVRLYKLGKIRTILINGGNGKRTNKGFNEGEFAKSELKIMGIPDSAILFEDRSANTVENAANAKRLLDSAQLKPPYYLITSSYHIPRATLNFKHAGIETIGFPCSYPAGREDYRLGGIIPQPEVLMRWEYYIRETAGYWLYRLKG